MEKKYQVFISSTYDDLKIEREKAIDAILRLEHIPIGMELFNAGDDEQWKIIQRAIDNTDYYVLIVGFRYGSVTEAGISYTEKEYDYAVSKKIPIMAFIKDRKMPTTVDERETEKKYQRKLDAFISKVQKKEVNYWKNSDKLATQITSSLINQIKLTPRTGWIRADFDPIIISQEIEKLTKENMELRKAVDNISQRRPNLRITILDPDNKDQEATLVYKYQHPEGNIHRRPLNVKDDLIDKIKDLVTEKDLQSYNDKLPAQEEIDEYNKLNTLYWNAQKNANCFRLGIINNGTGKAHDISVDMEFPEELLAYYDYDIEDIKKPEALNLPENPIHKAFAQLYTRRMPESLIQINSNLKPISSILEDIGNASLIRIMPQPFYPEVKKLTPGYYDRDYYVDDKHNKIEIKVDSLIHTRRSTSDKICFIATQKGIFTVDCVIMCEEYEESIKYSFNVEVE